MRSISTPEAEGDDTGTAALRLAQPHGLRALRLLRAPIRFRTHRRCVQAAVRLVARVDYGCANPGNPYCFRRCCDDAGLSSYDSNVNSRHPWGGGGPLVLERQPRVQSRGRLHQRPSQSTGTVLVIRACPRGIFQHPVSDRQQPGQYRPVPRSSRRALVYNYASYYLPNATFTAIGFRHHPGCVHRASMARVSPTTRWLSRGPIRDSSEATGSLSADWTLAEGSR